MRERLCYVGGVAPPALEWNENVSKRFDPQLLARLAAAKVVEIETRAGPRAPVHRTKIWVVVDARNVFVRSYRGEKGRWYREIRSHPDAALWLGAERIPVRAIRARTARSIARVSAGYRKKYGNSPPAKLMVRKEILQTTLRLEGRLART